VIDYQTYCQIRQLFLQKQLSLRQIAGELKLGFHTVRKWARRESYQRAAIPKRPSKLDPFKGDIIRLLEQHDYSAQQIFQQLKELGYQGRSSILRAFVREVRPKRRAAFLTLHFDPGQCAQVDWGCAGWVPVGSTHRRLSFFLMVLAYSRKMYLEFTLAETLEHFLACHLHAFEYFGGVVRDVWVDNCKVAVLSRAAGSVVFNPRYLDFANHYGFQIRACGVGQPQEKGRVENGVAYDKDKLVAEHVRRYDRNQDYELPDHVAPLLLHRKKAREQKLFLRFLALCPQAPDYYQQLEQRRLNPKHHVQKIVALSELYGTEAVARALEDAFTYQAFSCEYLLQQRQHPPEEPGALHLTRQQDLLELELPAPDLSLYDTKNFPDPSANP
jgi:transposase